ncbi:hypothetical protein [Pseudomonas sp. URIL14HWK12:I5]|uniref:hypothetical protein n=1 Tax=Pseudomonas sp. URIL14HWK12:I5 TaxID=1261630 RepID=UPI0009FDCD19|nr:hypothetical protein [Pseudomonas sp. URIL14HWK12:I5]
MELSNVPDPDQVDSGVAGNQQPGSLDDIAPTPPPLEGELLPRTVIRLIEGSPDHYGGDQLGPVISAIINDAQYDKEQARGQVTAIQARLDAANAELVEQRLINARLEEQLKSTEGQLKSGFYRNIFEKFLTFCSPVAFSVAIELFRLKSDLWWALAALGIGLLAVNFLPAKGKSS